MSDNPVNSIGGVLLFSPSGSQFLPGSASGGATNRHDFVKGTEISLVKDEYIKNGEDNFQPFHLLNAVKRSTYQKRAHKVITALAAGSITFVNPDGSTPAEARVSRLRELYKSLGLTLGAFLRPAVSQAYLFGGLPATLTFASNGAGFGLTAVRQRDYKTMRLGRGSMVDGEVVHDRHYYHRNWGFNQDGKHKKVKPNEKKAKSWLEWGKSPEKNADEVAYMYSWDPARPLGREVNRTQSYFIADMDGLSDFYPVPSWLSGASFNYIKSEFLLSCFDADDIQNGFNASGIVKVFHKSYKNPESGEAKQTFEEHKKLVEERLRGGYNSGSVTILPVGIDGEPTNDYMEFVPTPSTLNKGRHEVLDGRIIKNILSANGAIYPELFGIASEHSSLSEGADKLVNGVKLLNRFTVKPLKGLFDDPQSGFLNVVNDILGVPERAFIEPDLSVFLNLPETISMHMLHPDQWFELYREFGLKKPTEEQLASQLIPAYRTNTNPTT